MMVTDSKGVVIKYGDVAPGAKENFYPTVEGDITDFSEPDLFMQYNINFPNYGNPCELYQTPLNSSPILFPSDTTDHTFGIWSTQVSDENGNFSSPIVITFESDGQYSSKGITLTFDVYNDIFAKSVKIEWWRITEEGNTRLATGTYTPDNAEYFCQNAVDNYNKLIITFTGINMPHNRLKIRAIDYGYGTYFTGNELRTVKVIQELDPISSEIRINTTDFTLDSKSSVEYAFQQRQPLEVYFNGELISYAFVRSANRKSQKLWDIQSDDNIGILDSIPFVGGLYHEKDAVELLREISTVSKVKFDISTAFNGIKVSGHIPYTTCREALMQVAFALQAAVDTSGTDSIRIFELSEKVSQQIPKERTMQGQSFETSDTVTSVIVKAHSYLKSEKSITLYDAKESGIGDEILVVFPEPVHSFRFSIPTGGTIIMDEDGNARANENHAYIQITNPECQVIGYGYDHCTVSYTKKNPVVRADELEKIVEISDATLVSKDNAEAVLQKCYDWLTKVRTTNTRIVEAARSQQTTGGAIYGVAKYGTVKYGQTPQTSITGKSKSIKVGDIITVNTEYLGEVTGRVIKSTFNLNGNILVKEVSIV